MTDEERPTPAGVAASPDVVDPGPPPVPVPLEDLPDDVPDGDVGATEEPE